MPDEKNKHEHSFSEEDLGKMRKDVLEWIEKNDKKIEEKEVKVKKRAERKEKIANHPATRKFLNIVGKNNPKKEKPPQGRIARDSVKEARREGIFHHLPVFHKKSLKYTLPAAGAVLAVALYGIAGVYVFQSHDPITLSISSVFRIPALNVSGDMITYGEYAKGVEALRKISRMDIPSAWLSPTATAEKNYLRYLRIMVKGKDEGVFADFKGVRENSYFSYGGKGAFLVELQDKNISPEAFYAYFIIPEAVFESLVEKYSKESAAWKAALEKAEEIKSQLNEAVRAEQVAAFGLVKDNAFFIRENNLGFVPIEFINDALAVSENEIRTGDVWIKSAIDGVHVYFVRDAFAEMRVYNIIDYLIIPEEKMEDIIADKLDTVKVVKYIK